MSDLHAELNAAIEAVRLAARLTRSVRCQLVADHAVEKSDHSPVTVADYGAQALVLNHLAHFDPTIPAVGEEDASDLRQPGNDDFLQKLLRFIHEQCPEMDKASTLEAIDRGQHPGGATGRFWTLDPIDGTKGFLRNDQYAIALALIEEGQPILGVLGCPALSDTQVDNGNPGMLFAAARGIDAFKLALDDPDETRFPCRVSAQSDPASLKLCESVESAHSKQDTAATLLQSWQNQQPPIRMDSQCKYAVVADGAADLYLRLPTRADYQERIWDHAAGAFLVAACGGKVTDLDGNPLDFSCGRTLSANRGVVASNGVLHPAALSALEKLIPRI